jgi:hypothetical protein
MAAVERTADIGLQATAAEAIPENHGHAHKTNDYMAAVTK